MLHRTRESGKKMCGYQVNWSTTDCDVGVQRHPGHGLGFARVQGVGTLHDFTKPIQRQQRPKHQIIPRLTS